MVIISSSLVSGVSFRCLRRTKTKSSPERCSSGLSSEIPRWVVAGHSLGGLLAARVALSTRGRDVSFVLIGTTHPRDHDLSKLEARITKVYATNDGVAPVDGVMANRRLLPETTAWVEIKGGNHSAIRTLWSPQLFDLAPPQSHAKRGKRRRDEVLLDAMGATERREASSQLHAEVKTRDSPRSKS